MLPVLPMLAKTGYHAFTFSSARVLTLLGIGGLTAALTATADAAALTQASQSGGQYSYDIELGPNQGLVFLTGDQITMSGISGVTGAALLSGLTPFFWAPVTTPTSVTITDRNPVVFDPTPDGVIISAFFITSSVLTTGPSQYVIGTATVAFVGMVPGPVAVPEPGGVTTGLIGMALLFVMIPRKNEHRTSCPR